MPSPRDPGVVHLRVFGLIVRNRVPEPREPIGTRRPERIYQVQIADPRDPTRRPERTYQDRITDFRVPTRARRPDRILVTLGY